MIDGLRETTAYLHALIREEIALLRPSAGGARDIVLGGLSQGCAASLVGAALWDGEEGSLGAVVGLCGWLPFVEGVMAAGSGCGGGGGSVDLFERGGKDEGGLDSFERDGGEEVEEGKGFGAVEVLREMLEWSPHRGVCRCWKGRLCFWVMEMRMILCRCGWAGGRRSVLGRWG